MLLASIQSETDALELMDKLAEQALADKKLAEMVRNVPLVAGRIWATRLATLPRRGHRSA